MIGSLPAGLPQLEAQKVTSQVIIAVVGRTIVIII